jgi:hypothetical protein
MGMRWLEKTKFGQYYLTERIKFWIASRLDHFPSLCWSDLAMWAMNLDPWWAILPWSGYSFDQSCRYTNLQQYPYCGKCWRGDRWLEGCTPGQKAEAIEKYRDINPVAEKK